MAKRNEAREKRIHIAVFVCIIAYMILLPIIQYFFLEGIKIGDGINICLSEDGWNADQYLSSGYSTCEGSYTWTDGDEMKFQLVRAKKGNYRLRFNVLGTYNGDQTIKVILNGKEAANEEVPELDLEDPTQAQTVEFAIQLKSGRNTLAVQFPDTVSPKALGESDDERMLTLKLTGIDLTPVV